MNVNEVRINNLVKLIDGFKNKAEFSRTYLLDANYISMLINGHRKLGEKSARNLEIAIGKPPFYLDGGDVHPLDAYKETFNKLSDADREFALDILEALKRRNNISEGK